MGQGDGQRYGHTKKCHFQQSPSNHGIGWALCWHNLQIAWDQPKKQNNKQNNKQLTQIFHFVFLSNIQCSESGTLTERWTKGAIVRSRMYDMMEQTSITNTVIMNTHRPPVYHPHPRWTVFLCLANNVITLGHTNDVCTAVDELFYYFIVIQVVPSLVPLLHRIQLSGIWRLQQESENDLHTSYCLFMRSRSINQGRVLIFRWDV